ncbi:MAG: hypothetical protein ACSHYA_07790 [Opitutaceae bacterium]
MSAVLEKIVCPQAPETSVVAYPQSDFNPKDVVDDRNEPPTDNMPFRNYVKNFLTGKWRKNYLYTDDH